MASHSCQRGQRACVDRVWVACQRGWSAGLGNLQVRVTLVVCEGGQYTNVGGASGVPTWVARVACQCGKRPSVSGGGDVLTLVIYQQGWCWRRTKVSGVGGELRTVRMFQEVLLMARYFLNCSLKCPGNGKYYAFTVHLTDTIHFGHILFVQRKSFESSHRTAFSKIFLEAFLFFVLNILRLLLNEGKSY